MNFSIYYAVERPQDVNVKQPKRRTAKEVGMFHMAAPDEPTLHRYLDHKTVQLSRALRAPIRVTSIIIDAH